MTRMDMVGMAPGETIQVLVHEWVTGGGLAGSKCLEQKTPNYVSGSYKPGFKIDLHFKDLGLIMESSRALGVPLPATAVVQELFNAMRVKGRGGLDHSGVITLLEELAGLPEKA